MQNTRKDKIAKAIQKIDELLENEIATKKQRQTLTRLLDTANKLMEEANNADYGDIKRKYEILQKDSILNSQGALFDPEDMSSFNIDLISDFNLMEDYTADGVQIVPSKGGYIAVNAMNFTDKGIEKLLTYPAIKEYINNNWIDFLEYELEEAKKSQGVQNESK